MTETATPLDASGDRLLLRALRLPGPCRTLLVAPCRSGELCLRLTQLGCRVTGVDADERRVARAREQAAEKAPWVSFQVARIESMSFASRHFDAALCIDFLERTSDATLRALTIAELCRVASRYVVVSYARRFSLLGIAAPLRRACAPRSISRERLVEDFARGGFRLRADLPRLRFIDPGHIAVFQRK